MSQPGWVRIWHIVYLLWNYLYGQTNPELARKGFICHGWAFPGDSDTALAMSEGGERIRSLTAPTFVSIAAAARLGCNVVLSR